ANAPSESQRLTALNALEDAASTARSSGIGVNAGHGLNYRNVGAIVSRLDAEELHIGHSIVSRAIFVGIERAVREMKAAIERHKRL
ncbi:MAG: pyridoxine 5'-phosphate synthase, partial [Planctomycetes bacterium]|nr:pyridoxine 5'-phosphate synthase [Planctomycetota bacterium]